MILLLAAVAIAQDRFVPSPGFQQGAGGLELLDPMVGDRGSGWLATTGSSTELIPGGPRRVSAAQLSVGHTLAPSLRLDIAMPWLFAVVEDGAITRPPGDLKVGLTVPLRAHDAGIGVALGAGVYTPTSPLSSSLRGDLRLALGDHIGAARWRANIGVSTDAMSGPSVLLGIGGDQPLSPWALLGVEVWGTGGTSPASGMASSYLHVGPQQSPLMATLGAGIGLGEGPLLQVVAGLTGRWGQVGGDLDGDGVPDEHDACPAAPEDPDGFADGDGCPDPDDDADGVPDAIDLCPQEAEDPDGFDDADGCPENDNDLDGTVDGEDACPEAPGPLLTGGCPDTDGDGLADTEDECLASWGRPDALGCPDVDGDRVPDYRDACPHDAAPAGVDTLRSDGCPTDTFVSDGRIEVLGVVLFALNEATILPGSFPLLLKVSVLLAENPDITLIEIAGHTDDTGPSDYNRALSQRRAASVRRFLVESGRVDAARLVVTGYGEDRPLQDNAAEAGRQANRRVEFVILAVE